MALLYTRGTIICKLWEQFSQYFSEETAPTQKHLFDLVLSVLTLNGFQSVRFNYEHFIEEISDFKLKSYYFTLNDSRIELSDWMKRLTETALSIIPMQQSQQPIILSIDDTMIEKFGKKFENRARLFDHAAHNGSNYLDGHCFVSLLLSVPIQDETGCRYLSFPVGYRMWTGEKTKLSMAADLVRAVMKILGVERNICLCCDSWYPKGEVLELVNEFPNLTLICNVRSDTVMFDLPPERTRKRGRPRKYGERLSFTDFPLKEVPGAGFYAGSRAVLTNILGSRTVYATVTKAKKSDSFRLFLCTKAPDTLGFSPAFASTAAARAYAETDSAFLPLTVYALRWQIEVAYYEQKSFWSLGDYMLRSKVGIERLLNLLTLIYSSMTLLPYLDSAFSSLKQCSPQQARFLLGQLIQRQVFFTTFAAALESDKNTVELSHCLRNYLSQLNASA